MPEGQTGIAEDGPQGAITTKRPAGEDLARNR